MERFVIIVNGFQPLTIITTHSILDAAAAPDPSLVLAYVNIEHFPTLNRIKASMLSAMADSRLNLIIDVYKEKLNEIKRKLIPNEFIKVKEPRIATFGLYQIWAIFCFSSFIIIT